MSNFEQVPSISDLERWGGGFPGEHEFSTLDQLDNVNGQLDEALTAANALINNWQGNKFVGMYLYGTPGTGKTHFMIGLGRALHDAGSDLAYASLPRLTENGYDTPYEWSVGNFNHKGRSPFNIFGESNGGAYSNEDRNRNRKAVLLLDEYTPANQKQAAAAIEAAAEFGGALVITSNYADPFKILEPQKSDLDIAKGVLMKEIIAHADEETTELWHQQKADEALAVTASLRSRVASGFRFLEFSGEDQRPQNSFWA